MPEYYPDIAFLVNFFADYILLYLTGRIRRRKVKRARLCLSAAAGSLAAVVLTSFFRGGGFALAGLLLGGTAMCVAAFGTRGMGKNLLTLFFCTFVMGGMLYAVGALLAGNHILMQEGDVFANAGNLDGTKRWLVPTAFLLSIFTVSAVVLLLVIKAHRENAARPIYPVRFFIGETLYQCRGLLDTGNGLYDPFRKKPVLVLAAQEFKLPLEEFCKEQPQKVRYIPYRAVGTKEGILCGAELAAVTIEEDGQEICLREVPAVYAQLSAQGRGYEVILHPDFF